VTYQPPVGIWRTSTERELLWAVKQVLILVERARPEDREVRKWERRLKRDLTRPVNDYPWTKWWRENVEVEAVAKADPQVPDEILKAWAAAPERVSKLWVSAAKWRTKREGLPFDEEDMAKGLREAFKQVKTIPDTHRDLLRSLMKRAMDERTGQLEFARMIRREWPVIATSKAKQIAVTEWNRAASFATIEGYKAQGETHKVWFNVGDNRVCPICESNGAEGEVPINHEYAHGDGQPPAHPSCRCSISSA
jgi:SPP1 gp7 family putative phage head morphogenesis protein